MPIEVTEFTEEQENQVKGLESNIDRRTLVDLLGDKNACEQKVAELEARYFDIDRGSVASRDQADYNVCRVFLEVLNPAIVRRLAVARTAQKANEAAETRKIPKHPKPRRPK